MLCSRVKGILLGMAFVTDVIMLEDTYIKLNLVKIAFIGHSENRIVGIFLIKNFGRT